MKELIQELIEREKMRINLNLEKRQLEPVLE